MCIRDRTHAVRFFHDGLEFRPRLDGHGTGYDYVTVRSADYAPRLCPAGSHTEPDAATGAECICKEGFEPDAASATGGIESCHRSCSNGTRASFLQTESTQTIGFEMARKLIKRVVFFPSPRINTKKIILLLKFLPKLSVHVSWMNYFFWFIGGKSG